MTATQNIRQDIGAGYDPVAGSRIIAERIAGFTQIETEDEDEDVEVFVSTNVTREFSHV